MRGLVALALYCFVCVHVANAQGQMAWTINLIALGADPGGTTDSLEILNSAIGNNIKVEIPGGTYNLSADNIGPPVGSSWWVEPTAVFTGAGHLTAYPAIPYQGTDVFSNDMLSVLYGTGFGGYGNIFARSTFVRNASGTNAVAVFGEAQQDSVGGGAWGSNFVGYSYVSGGSAIAQELNFGALVSGGIGNGLVLAASGGFPTKGPAIQIQANNTNAVMPYAIRFHERFGSEIANSFLFADGPFVLPRFLDFSAAIATTAELDFPSLKIGPTPAGQNGRLEIDGSSGTGSVAIKAIGFGGTPATVKNIEIDALGSGGVYLGSRGGGGNFNFHAINGGASTIGWSAVTSATPQTDVIYGAESYNVDQNVTYQCKGACTQTLLNTVALGNSIKPPTHIVSAQMTAPSVTGGGGSTISGTDTAATITVGASSTNIIVTFNVPYNAAPHCVVTWEQNLAAMAYSVSATAITISQTATSGNLIDYVCIAPSGG